MSMTSLNLRNTYVHNTKMADAQERVESDPELESVEEGEEETANKFANDGSFMDMFKKRLDELKKEVEANETPDTKDSPPRTIVPSEEEVQRVKIYQVLCRQRISCSQTQTSYHVIMMTIVYA